MAAGDALRIIHPVVAPRPQSHIDDRPTLDRLDQAHQSHGSEIAATRTKARTEVGDLERVAVRVGEGGLHDGGVAHVPALRLGHIAQIDREHTADGAAAIAPQQRAKHRIRIRFGQTHPHDSAATVDQCGNLAIADDREIQVGDRAHSPRESCSAAMPRNQRRTAAESSTRYCPCTRSPTAIETPPWPSATRKPPWSVRSSPTNTGRRPENGGSFINSLTAAPLLKPRGITSKTMLPSWM